MHKQFKGELPGIVHVTEGGLFGHKKVLDWHANKPSDPNRCSMVWIYAVKGSEGSITSWIDNRKSYNDLPDDIKELTGQDLLDAANIEAGKVDILDGSPPCSAFSVAGAGMNRK